MRIAALSRGGLAVFGGHYDARKNEAVNRGRDETVAVTIEYPSDVSDVTAKGCGLTVDDVTTNGSKVILVLTAIGHCAHAEVFATVAGALRVMKIRCEGHRGAGTGDVSSDAGQLDFTNPNNLILQ